MPTYDYRCDDCGHAYAAFQRITEDPLKDCPECGKASLRRLIGAGAGIIFRGSGFYETDYKRSRPSNGGDAKGTSDKGSGEGKSSGAGSSKKTSDGGD